MVVKTVGETVRVFQTNNNNIALNLVFRFMPRHDSSVLMLVNVVRAIIILLLISFSDLPSSVIKLPRYMMMLLVQPVVHL